MHSFTTALIAASAFSAAVSGSPLQARATCGSAPAGSGSQQPLSQPTGINTAQACQAQCNANGSCQSFVFGMVDNAVKCMLFSVPAASVPKQATNLVAFDKACTSVPAVVPTTANPTGVAQGSQGGAQGGAKGGAQSPRLAIRATCGSAPAGTGSQTPLSQPAGITTAANCQAQCNGNPSCQSFVFGMVDNANKCMLFSVAASAVPKQSSANLVTFDKACTSVPTVVPTTQNPTGANNGNTGANNGNTGANNGNTGANNGNTGANNGNTGNTPAGQTNGGNTQRLSTRAVCGAAPTGPAGNANPIATPSNIKDSAACKLQCQANPACKS